MAKPQKKIISVSTDKVPEVIQFLDAEKTMEEFVADNQAVFDQFRELADRYNNTLEAAEKAVRGQEVKCGPFDLYQFSTKYNADALFNAVGRNKFLEAGGTMKQVTEYAVDKDAFESAVAKDLIPEEVVKEVRKVTPNYHAPKPLRVP